MINVTKFLFSGPGILILFVVLASIGGLIKWMEEKNNLAEEQKELDHTIASFSGMKSDPAIETSNISSNVDVEETDCKSGESNPIEKFYSYDVPRRDNIKRILKKEQEIMRKRAKDIAERDKF